MVRIFYLKRKHISKKCVVTKTDFNNNEKCKHVDKYKQQEENVSSF